MLTEAILRRHGLAVKGGRRGCGCGAAGATLDGRASIESRTELRGYVSAAGNQGDRSSFVLVKGFPVEGFQVFTVDGLENSPRQSNSLPDSKDVRCPFRLTILGAPGGTTSGWRSGESHLAQRGHRSRAERCQRP